MRKRKTVQQMIQAVDQHLADLKTQAAQLEKKTNDRNIAFDYELDGFIEYALKIRAKVDNLIRNARDYKHSDKMRQDKFKYGERSL